MRNLHPPTEPPDAMLNRVERRIAGRRMAADVLDLLGADAADAAFMEALIDSLRATLPSPPAEPAVESPPIGRLGATRMPFGQHLGQTLDDTPLEYLDWLCRNQEDFCRDLRAYLKHPELESRRRAAP